MLFCETAVLRNRFAKPMIISNGHERIGTLDAHPAAISGFGTVRSAIPICPYLFWFVVLPRLVAAARLN
jgi:hypothetical protein